MRKLLTMYAVDLRFNIINGSDDGEFPPEKQFSRDYMAVVTVCGDVSAAISEAKRRVELKYPIEREDALALKMDKIEGSLAVDFEVRSVTTIGAETV